MTVVVQRRGFPSAPSLSEQRSPVVDGLQMSQDGDSIAIDMDGSKVTGDANIDGDSFSLFHAAYFFYRRGGGRGGQSVWRPEADGALQFDVHLFAH